MLFESAVGSAEIQIQQTTDSGQQPAASIKQIAGARKQEKKGGGKRRDKTSRDRPVPSRKRVYQVASIRKRRDKTRKRVYQVASIRNAAHELRRGRGHAG
jgi:hypothetical protein